MSVKIDLTGKRFGKLVVLSEAHSDNKHLYWNCQCDCGNKTVVCGDSLKRSLTKSCGCLNSQMVKNRFRKHGDSKTRLYGIWTGMIYRCENPNATGFKNWGGKGITVCPEWRDDFEKFRDWSMENGYADNLEIDRINPDGNYEPSNCQWLTKSENLMDKTIIIVWDRGKMSIYLEQFFPCSAEKLKKLFKVIQLDFEHDMQILSDINDYMLEVAELYEAEKKSQGKEYWRLNQIVSDLDREIKDKKKANGVPFTKDELKAARERLKQLKAEMREAKSTAETAIRKFKQISKNLEQLKDYVQKITW